MRGHSSELNSNNNNNKENEEEFKLAKTNSDHTDLNS